MQNNTMIDMSELEHWLVVSQASQKIIYTLCFFVILALITVMVTRKLKVPTVVGYVFLGILFSVDSIRLLPFFSESLKQWYSFSIKSMGFISSIALSFIAFTIGSELSHKYIRKMGKSIFVIAVVQVFASLMLVVAGMLLIGQPLYLSLLLGTIATATAPAATVMVIREYNAKGPVTSMIMGVVGIDDALALILFSLISPLAFSMYFGQTGFSLSSSLLIPILEVGGSFAMGILLGYLSQRLMAGFEDNTKKVLLLLATVIGGTALSYAFHLEFLLTNMAIGFAYRNFPVRNLDIKGAMDTLTIPLYALFFILAGTEIRFSGIASAGFLVLAAVYTIARVIGKVGGATVGARLAQAPENIRKYVGLGLLPQSGVAIALAYTIQQRFAGVSDIGTLVFNVILFTAALTEVFGPFATKYALVKSGETQNMAGAEVASESF